MSKEPPRLLTAVLAPTSTGILFGILAWRFGEPLDLLAYSYLAAVGVPLAVIDATEQRLPTAVLLPSFGVLITLFGVDALTQANGAGMIRSLSGMTCVAGFYLALALATQGGLGAGDVKLGGLLGLSMGWQSWSTVLVGTILGWTLAALARLVLRFGRRWHPDSPTPLGPFLLAGALTAIVVTPG